MYAVNLLEETAGSAGSTWIPVIVLGWFVLMTIVGWRVSRRNAAGTDAPLDAHAAPSEDSRPTEQEHH